MIYEYFFWICDERNPFPKTSNFVDKRRNMKKSPVRNIASSSIRKENNNKLTRYNKTKSGGFDWNLQEEKRSGKIVKKSKIYKKHITL